MKPLDSIDLTNRKPRRFKGTPSYRLRNIISAVVIAYTLTVGALSMFAPATRDLRDTFEVLGAARLHELEETTDEERWRQRQMLLKYQSKFGRHHPNYEEEVLSRAGQ